ncbi:MAG: hypothetical protein RR956_04050 [Christensenella sp.]
MYRKWECKGTGGWAYRKRECKGTGGWYPPLQRQGIAGVCAANG